jgi:uncharacterized membrane-anchored protein YitT (DUF2179 family)
MKSKVKEFLLINLGVIMVALGMYFFLMPNNLATGGANGLAIVINKFVGNISVGTIMLIINLILFILAFLAIGKNFGGKTIYSSFAVSLLIFLLEKVLPIKKSITGEVFLELIFGILISGVGMGIVFNQNASTGGTDIIAKILNKFFHIDLGKGVLLSDLAITILAAFAFGLKLSMYAMLGVIINGFVIDGIIEGINMCKEVTIISDEYDEIRRYIKNDLQKTSTIYSATGDFTEVKKEVIVVVIGRRDFVRLKKYINSIDKEAFITVRNTCEVFGNGFKSLTL